MAILEGSLVPSAALKSQHQILLQVIVVCSGLAGLGYQMVWTRLLSVALGHEVVAVLAVVAAFFVGLALGGLWVNNSIRTARRPERWYSLIELTIALWSVVLVVTIPLFNRWLPIAIGADPSPLWQWSLSFVSSLVLLFPATLAMGATLPVLERLAKVQMQQHRPIASLYALNTLGAVLGTLLTTFVLVRSFGLSATLLMLAAINIFCAGSVLLLPRGNIATSIAVQSSYLKNQKSLAFALFLTGLLGIGYEVLLVRLLSQILENTVYTYAAILAVYLLATVIGAALYRRFQVFIERRDWHQTLRLLITAVILSCLLSLVLLQACEKIYPWLWATLGKNLFAAVLGELTIAALVFMFPAMCMAALFCHLVCRAAERVGFGYALALNTLGAALAPFLWGVLIMPLLGAKWSVLSVVVGYSLLLLGQWRHEKRVVSGFFLGFCAALLVFMALPLSYRFVKLAPGSDLLAYRDGVMAAVAVVADSDGHRHLKVNNHFTMGGTASRLSDHRQSHIPLLLHGNPNTVLYLGLGSGVTFEAAQYYKAQQVTGVELIPEVLPLLNHFIERPQKSTWGTEPTLIAGDARRFVLASQQRYDVIIGEIFHPSRDGAGSLYTQEHFTAVSHRLADDGLFCQWLPLFQLDIENLKTIVRTFVKVFPHAQLYLGHLSLTQPILCLLGSERGFPVRENWLLDTVTEPRLQQALVNTRLNSDFALFGALIADTEALAEFAGTGDLNTDDFPRVTYQAPDFVYGAPESPGERLVHLLQALPATHNPVRGEPLFAARVNNYRQARDEFIRLGVAFPPNNDIERWAERVAPPLMRLVQQSQDFEPAYRTLLATAERLYERNPQMSLAILKKLDSIAPDFPEARRLALRLLETSR